MKLIVTSDDLDLEGRMLMCENVCLSDLTCKDLGEDVRVVIFMYRDTSAKVNPIKHRVLKWQGITSREQLEVLSWEPLSELLMTSDW